MKKSVWILNHYATASFFEAGGRHYWIAFQLKKMGYLPVIFCASSVHNGTRNENWGNEIYTIKLSESGIPYVFVKARDYCGNGKNRILNMMDFYINVQKAGKIYAQEVIKPDIVYASSVHPMTLIAGQNLAKKYHVPCICEVRDLWPESFIAYNILKRNNPLLPCLYQGEKWIYKHADALIFTMEGGRQYIIDKGWDKASGGPVELKNVYHINNGIDLDMFEANACQYKVKDPDLSDDSIFKVIYTGSIRQANVVGSMVEVASILKSKGLDHIKILIWGTGNCVEELKRQIEKEHLLNIVYKGGVAKKYVPSILRQGNVNIYLLKSSSLTKYGLSLNKSFEYMASGRPIISNAETPYSIINRYGCGIEHGKLSTEEIADNIRNLASLSETEYRKLCENAYKAAENYDFTVLSRRLAEIIENVRIQ